MTLKKPCPHVTLYFFSDVKNDVFARTEASTDNDNDGWNDTNADDGGDKLWGFDKSTEIRLLRSPLHLLKVPFRSNLKLNLAPF